MTNKEMRHVIQYIPKSEVEKIYRANKADIDAGILSVWDIKDTDDIEKEVIVPYEKDLFATVKKIFPLDEFGEIIIDRQWRKNDKSEWKIGQRCVYHGENGLDFEEYHY